MPSTTNYIDDTERRFVDANYLAVVGDLWTSTLSTISVDTITYQDPAFGSLKVTGGITADARYNIWDTPLTDVPSQYAITTLAEGGDYIESFCWVRPTKNCTITLHLVLTEVYLNVTTQEFMLSTSPADVVEGAKGSHRIEIGASDGPKWHLIRAIPVEIPDDGKQYSIGFHITVDYDSPLAVGDLNISRPTIIRTHAILDNLMVVTCGRVIPNAFLAQDNADFSKYEVTYPMLRLIDISTTTANDIFLKHDDIEYIDISEGFSPAELSSYSTLVNPTLADSATLEWLAQFRGRSLLVSYEPSTEGEAWELFILDESTLDGTDVVATSSLPTTGFSGGVEEYFKWQVSTGYYGHNAGTRTAMESAIKLLLSDTKTINATWTWNSIHFQTKIGETYGGDLLSVGDPSPYVLAILEPARPLGMVATHELIA